MKKDRHLLLAKIPLTFALLACQYDLPNWYYDLIRIFGTIGFVFLSYQERIKNNNKFALIFGAFAIILNPVIKISFDKDEWIVVDNILAFMIIINLVLESHNRLFLTTNLKKMDEFITKQLIDFVPMGIQLFLLLALPLLPFGISNMHYLNMASDLEPYAYFGLGFSILIVVKSISLQVKERPRPFRMHHLFFAIVFFFLFFPLLISSLANVIDSIYTSRKYYATTTIVDKKEYYRKSIKKYRLILRTWYEIGETFNVDVDQNTFESADSLGLIRTEVGEGLLGMKKFTGNIELLNSQERQISF